MRLKKRMPKNYIDLIPVKNSRISYIDDGENKIALRIENNGIFNRFAQKFFHKPKSTYIHLDEYGTFIWLAIDGKKTIYQIGQSLSEKFGDKIEPIYPRLVQYFHNIENYGFVEMRAALP